MAAAQAGMYIGIVGGSIALLGICVGILYQRHRKDVKELQARELIIQERMQQVVDQNLPPFYVDHELDPVCIYEHELPPDAVPPVQPILVHSTSSDADHHSIPPEEDPLVSSPPLQRGMSSFPFAAVPGGPSDSVVVDNNYNSASPQPGVGTETTQTTAAGTDTSSAVIEHRLSAEREEASTASQGLSAQVSDLGLSSLISPPVPAAVALSSSSPSQPPVAMASPLSITASPRLINQAMLDLARLPAPPSYDVPNRVVDRSPLDHPLHHRQQHFQHHHHSHSASDIQFMLSPEAAYHQGSRQQQQDYFAQAITTVNQRTRAHTFSHPSPVHQSYAHLPGEDQQLPDTPRYSLEFPSDVPHQHHLEEHQRARAQYALWAASSSPASLHGDDQDTNASMMGRPHHPYPIRMQDRSFSQPFYSSSLRASSSTADLDLEGGLGISGLGYRPRQGAGAGQGGRPLVRSRASTIGESSKLLMQRMQTLWRKTASASASAAQSPVVSGQNSVNASSLNLPVAVSFYSQRDQQQQQEQEGEEEVEVGSTVVVIVEPQEEGEEEGSVSALAEDECQQNEEGAEEESERANVILNAATPTQLQASLPTSEALTSTMAMAPVCIPVAVS